MNARTASLAHVIVERMARGATPIDGIQRGTVPVAARHERPADQPYARESAAAGRSADRLWSFLVRIA